MPGPIIAFAQPPEGGPRQPIAAVGQSFDLQEWSGSGPEYLHVHHDDDEAWHILEGTLTFRLFAVEATRRWEGDGIFTNAVMPGAVLSARVRQLVAATPSAPALEYRSPEQGAAPTVMLAALSMLEGVGGRYFENGQEAQPHVPGTVTGVAAYALDPEQARRLWEASLEMLA